MSHNSASINETTAHAFDEPSLDFEHLSSLTPPSYISDFDTIILRCAEVEITPFNCHSISIGESSFDESSFDESSFVSSSPHDHIQQITKSSFDRLKGINNTYIIKADSKTILDALRYFLMTCDIAYSYNFRDSAFNAQACYSFGLVEFSITLNRLCGTNTHIINFHHGRGTAIICINIFIQLQHIIENFAEYIKTKPIFDINRFNYQYLRAPVKTTPLTDSEKTIIVLHISERLTTLYDDIMFNSLNGLLSYAQPDNPLYDTIATSGKFLNQLFNIICCNLYSVQSMTLAAFMLASFLEMPFSCVIFAQYCNTTALSFKRTYEYLIVISTSSGSYFTRPGYKEVHDYQIEHLRRFCETISRKLSLI